MGYTWENDCVSCERCIGCRRRNYKAYFCDKCEEETNDLYVSEDGKEVCWDCYKEQYEQRICCLGDSTLCANCGNEEEELFLVDGEWVCESCLMDMAERVEIDD